MHCTSCDMRAYFAFKEHTFCACRVTLGDMASGSPLHKQGSGNDVTEMHYVSGAHGVIHRLSISYPGHLRLR